MSREKYIYQGKTPIGIVWEDRSSKKEWGSDEIVLAGVVAVAALATVFALYKTYKVNQ